MMKVRIPVKMLAWTAAILCGAGAGIQFIRPTLTNPVVTADPQAPAEVKDILRTSCYNCHSNETRLSWFDEPAPAYWMVVRDVNQARKRLNFSDLGKLPAAQQKAVLFEAVSQIELGAMPLPAYQHVHSESEVTAEKLAVLKKYLAPAELTEATTAAEAGASDEEYAKWIQQGAPPAQIAPAPNGIEFIPGYKNWKAISSTERVDNHTMRQILGNEVAVTAIEENHIDPWPDGTAFAKVAWLQERDANGLIRPGRFFQVEFMIRDAERYAGTLGWGWARWRGTELKPYGADAAFTAECVGCHNPLRATNYVFTQPIRGEK